MTFRVGYGSGQFLPDPDPTGSESATLSVMFRCCASCSAGEGRGGLANVRGGGGGGSRRGYASPEVVI